MLFQDVVFWFLGVVAIGASLGPPPMPGDLVLEPASPGLKANAIIAMAHSPRAPLLAIGGHRQVVLYDTSDFQIAGILPFAEGTPHSLSFTHDGKMLLVGGGRGAQLGVAALYDIETGKRLLCVGDELDTVIHRLHGRSGREPTDRSWCGPGESDGDAADLLGGDTALFCGPLGRAVFEFEVPPTDEAVGVDLREDCFVDGIAGDEVVLTVVEVADEIPAPQSFDQNHMGDGDGERSIFSRQDRQPLICLGCGSGKAGVDDGDLRLVAHFSPYAHCMGHLAIGADRIGAPT